MKKTKNLILILIVGGILLGGSVLSTIYLSSPGNDIQVASTQGGLVGFWDFNGDAKDRTPYSNHGTVSGAALTTDRKEELDKAYDFDGASAFIEIPAVTFSSGAATVAMWVNSDTSQTKPLFDLKIGAGLLAYHGSSVGGNESTFVAMRGEHEMYTAASSLSNNVWQHLVYVYDGNDDDLVTSYKIYINGVSQSLTRRTGEVGGSTSNNYIAREASAIYFDGKIDDVRIYDRALSATEVKALYESYDGGIQVSSLEKGLVAYWDFNGDVKDKTPYSSHGTIVGTVSSSADQKGQAGKGRYFNNVSYIDAGTGANLSLTGSQTWAVWVKPLDIWQNKHIISKAVCCWSGYTLQGGGIDGGLFVVLAGVYTDFLGPAGTYTYNVWQHLVISYNKEGSTLTLYKNGAYVNHANVTGSVTQYSGSFKIGRYSGADANYYYGYMGEVRLYNRALPAAEVKLLYDSYR